MKRLNVFLHRENDDRLLVGQLGESEHRTFFEYDPAFLADPLWLSPFKLPPEPGLHEHRDLGFGPLFGLFDDSLPDGWGLLLMDRFFRKNGIDPARISPLDRLAYLGSDTMGALTYQPATPKEQVSALGTKIGLKRTEIAEAIDRVTEAVSSWPRHARTAGVSRKTEKFIASVHAHVQSFF